MGQAYPLAARFSVKGCREQPLFIWLAAYGMFPNPNIKKLLPFDKDLLERRLVAWKEVVGTNYDNFPIGLICVCSDHFQSGKPANICNVNDIDWIPSKNLDLLVANKTRNTENANDDHSQNSNDFQAKKAMGGPAISVATPVFYYSGSCMAAYGVSSVVVLVLIFSIEIIFRSIHNWITKFLRYQTCLLSVADKWML
ncbi:hypothetical protein OUZ56_009213 [Daphnia magna]|uniref:THAP-type domain-containing protein n=1 Tax=Daphnia magna TaxID=35525 RepID=A0ABR0AFH6_9CRUS|nr:hypothetical protein OUZ56_009213 [Daphnia magna]